MRQATLRVRHQGEPESDLSAEYPSLTLRSVSSRSGGATIHKRIVEVTGPEAALESFLADMRAEPAVLEAEPLSPTADARTYVSLVVDAESWDSVAGQLDEVGVHHKMGTTIRAGWERWVVYPEDGAELSAVVERLRAAGNDVELVADVELDEVTVPDQLDVDRLLDDLTRRQRDALAAAVAVDYYGPGPGGGVDDVADVLGVARTTAWEHLTRAEGKVMSRIGDYLEPVPE